MNECSRQFVPYYFTCMTTYAFYAGLIKLHYNYRGLNVDSVASPHSGFEPTQMYPLNFIMKFWMET